MRQSSSAMLTECVFVLARIALTDREMFIRLVSAAAQVENVHEEKVWEVILDQFWRQVSHPVSLVPLWILSFYPSV
jgi:hypothetical protein